MTAAPQTVAPAGADLGRLARGGMLNLVGTGVSGMANLVLVVLVTRGFPKAEAGIFFAATTVFLLGVRISDLGVSTGLVYFMARFRALGLQYRIKQILKVGLTPAVIASVITGTALFVFAPELASVAVRGHPGPFATFLRILAVFLPVAMLSDATLSATRGYGTIRPTALVEKVARPAAQVLLTLVAVLLASGNALTLAWVVPYLGSATAALIWLSVLRTRRAKAAIRPPDAPPEDIRQTAREFWRFTAPRAVTGVVQLALQRMDIVLVAALRGPAEAAVYTAATRFLVVGQLAAQAFTQVVEPKLSELLGHGDRAAARTVYQTSTCWLVLLNWPFYLSFVACAPFVLRLFGPGYETGSTVVIVLAAAMLVATACGMVDTVLIMAGKTTWNLGNALLALTVNVVVDLILIPQIGILGAAIGWGIGILTKNLVPLTQIGLTLHLQPLGQGTRLAMLLSAACFGVLPFVVARLVGAALVPLIGSLAVGAAVYCWFCWRYRRTLDLDALLALRRQRSGRGGGGRHRADSVSGVTS